MNAMMNETLNIGGALLVKLFGRTDMEISRFQQRAAPVRDIGIRRAVLGNSFFVIIGLLSAIGTALVYGLGGYMVIQGAFTVGTIVAFGVSDHLYVSLQGLANAPVEFATSIVSFERVFEVIDLPTEIEEKPHASEFENVKGELVFEDVSFKYELNQRHMLSDVRRFGHSENVVNVLSGDSEGGDGRVKKGNGQGDIKAEDLTARSQAREYALEEISFHVMPGQLLALVGPSGAGKTTLTYLIPRLYDPTAGRILIDGRDLRDVTLASFLGRLGW
jgi:ATP-binding cassette subfamily B protein